VRVGEKIRTEMVLASALTLVAEGVIVYFIVTLLGLPLFAVFLFLALLWVIQWIAGPYFISRRCREVDPSDPEYGWLHGMVEELASGARMGKPRIYVSNDPFPNAFAFGNSLRRGIAFTKPILEILTQEELKAVAGHELGHLKHHDVEAGIAFGLLPLVLNWIGSAMASLGILWMTAASDEVGILLGMASLAIGWMVTIVALAVNIFVLWFNRLRESLADLHAIKLLGNNGYFLATALAKLQLYMRNVKVDPIRGVVLTVPPAKIRASRPEELLREWKETKISPLADVLSTHPHPAKRVKMILEAINYG